jgi:hypothetical protein
MTWRKIPADDAGIFFNTRIASHFLYAVKTADNADWLP